MNGDTAASNKPDVLNSFPSYSANKRCFNWLHVVQDRNIILLIVNNKRQAFKDCVFYL